MLTMHERVRLSVLREWANAALRLKELWTINERQQVLTREEKAVLRVSSEDAPWIVEKYAELREQLAERGEEEPETRGNPNGVIFSYYYQRDIAERFRWCPPLRWLLMRVAANRLARVCDKMEREGWR